MIAFECLSIVAAICTEELLPRRSVVVFCSMRPDRAGGATASERAAQRNHSVGGAATVFAKLNAGTVKIEATIRLITNFAREREDL